MNALRAFLLFFVFTNPLFGQIGRTVDKDSIIQLQTTAKELLKLRKFSQALAHSQRALKYADLLENDSLVAESYRTIGSVYLQMRSQNQAIQNYEKAISYYNLKKNERRLLTIYNNITKYLLKNKFYAKADEYLQKSLVCSKKFTNEIASIVPKHYMGKLYLVKKEYAKAQDCFDKVIDFCTNNPKDKADNELLEQAYYYKGKTLRLLGNMDEAKQYYQNVISICDPIHKTHLELLSLVYQDLATIYRAEGNIDAESRALEKYAEYYETFSEQQKEETLSEIVLKYGIDEYENRLEVIEDDRESKELYIRNYKRLTTILVIILIVLGILTGIFYLNQRAKIRTNALLSKQNQELFEAKKQIENVSKIRSNFFSLISHELRTPLYAIIGMTNLLLLEKPEKYQERYLKSLKFSGEHLLAIINNILQMNKIEASKMKAVKENVDLRKSVKNVVNSVDFLVKENRNSIDIKIDERIPAQLLGDSLKISQILFNLLDNAVRYNMESAVRLRIYQVSETLETVTLKFSVKDNGLGIPQQKKHIVFENLEKGIVLGEDNGYLELGLGLTTVNNLLKVLKSKLHLRSVLGKGSEFYFELELGKIKSGVEEDEFENKNYHFDNLEILIVDDNAVNGLLTQKILERQNVKTKVVNSGFSALEIIEKQSFDLILMDMFMPKLNGLETIQKIRESDNDIPIILLTAMEISDAYAKVVDTKISGVISKPFEPEMLYDKIDYVIHQQANDEE